MVDPVQTLSIWVFQSKQFGRTNAKSLHLILTGYFAIFLIYIIDGNFLSSCKFFRLSEAAKFRENL
jgi:hypothetical protein